MKQSGWTRHKLFLEPYIGNLRCNIPWHHHYKNGNNLKLFILGIQYRSVESSALCRQNFSTILCWKSAQGSWYGSSMVDMGISSNIMKSPSPRCFMTIWDIIINNDTLHWSVISINRDLVAELDPMVVFDDRVIGCGKIEVSINDRVWHADRGRILLRTPGPVPLGPSYVLLVETNPFPNLSLFYRTMLFEYPSVLSRFCLPWLPISGTFHRTFATGAASQQRSLIPPDTWSCPIWDLHLF